MSESPSLAFSSSNTFASSSRTPRNFEEVNHYCSTAPHDSAASYYASPASNNFSLPRDSNILLLSRINPLLEPCEEAGDGCETTVIDNGWNMGGKHRRDALKWNWLLLQRSHTRQQLSIISLSNQRYETHLKVLDWQTDPPLCNVASLFPSICACHRRCFDLSDICC